MESRYGIGINNRYALFLDEEGEEVVAGGEDDLVALTKKANAAAAAAAANAKSVKEEQAKKEVAANANKKEPANKAARDSARGNQQNKNRDGKLSEGRSHFGVGLHISAGLTGKLSNAEGNLQAHSI